MAGTVGRTALGLALLAGAWASAWPGDACAQAGSPGDGVHKSVRGRLETVDTQLNGIIMTTDEGKRVAWQFSAPVIARLSPFKTGAPVIVIYRERGGGKAVTAVAFPGTADRPIYVNTSEERVQLVGGPLVNGACGQPSEVPLSTTTIPAGGQAVVADACWCCAPAGETCIPGNKTGNGQAFLARCFK
jgi:hypothetical protein